MRLEDVYGSIGKNAKILDVGCLGFRQHETSKRLGSAGHRHFGIDLPKKCKVPHGFTYKQADLNKNRIPFDDDFFDLVVASHIMEHVRDPLALFSELARVCKPGGYVYVEAPSERSLLLPGMPFKHELFCSLSFYDDPTHISRPWTPQSLYRLAKYYGCDAIKCGYLASWKIRALSPLLLTYSLIAKNGPLLEYTCWNTIGWCSYLVAKKPATARGKPKFSYYIPKR
ncbi:Ubiquinone biosynthesis O-methyltransferase [uncultured archaeon]|nr:Ubiquinone biosynthesis O-methyltransferase [uncultured archaeon]